MSLEDQSRTLEFDDGGFKILLETSIANLAETRALLILISEAFVTLGLSQNTLLNIDYDQSIQKERDKILKSLYLRFGALPPGLFEDHGDDPEDDFSDEDLGLPS